MTDVADSEAPAKPAPRRNGWGTVRLVVSGLGQALITAGLVILLFVGYELWFTGIYTHHQQQLAEKQIEQTFTAEQAPVVKSPSGKAHPVVKPLKHGKNGDVVYPPVAQGSAQTILYVPRL